MVNEIGERGKPPKVSAVSAAEAQRKQRAAALAAKPPESNGGVPKVSLDMLLEQARLHKDHSKVYFVVDRLIQFD